MRRRPREQQGGSASWMLTYGDMMTLLLTFFVLLFAFSSIDEGRFSAIISAFQGYFGIMDMSRIDGDPVILPFDPSELAREQMLNLYEQLTSLIEATGIDGVHLEQQERGLIIRFAEQVFFDLGEATLKPEALDILSAVAEFLRDLPNPLRVEGHTDNWPIRTARFPSNWELSVHRATNVVRYLINEEGFDPQKLSAVGYAEYRPIRPNDTAEDRAMNRRVDIVIMNIDLWDYEPNWGEVTADGEESRS